MAKEVKLPPKTRPELINSLMNSNSSFVLGTEATNEATWIIRELLAKVLVDDETFQSTWKKFFGDT